jgi:hypothetical protein
MVKRIGITFSYISEKLFLREMENHHRPPFRMVSSCFVQPSVASNAIYDPGFNPLALHISPSASVLITVLLFGPCLSNLSLSQFVSDVCLCYVFSPCPLWFLQHLTPLISCLSLCPLRLLTVCPCWMLHPMSSLIASASVLFWLFHSLFIKVA